jgi:hypothetical protein
MTARKERYVYLFGGLGKNSQVGFSLKLDAYISED